MVIKKNQDLKKYYSKKWKEGGYDHPKFIGGIDIRKIYDRERKNRTLNYLDPNKEEIILDAGCGNGKFTLKLSKRCKKIYGIDITRKSFESSNKKAFKNVVFKEMNLESIHFKKDYFDKIVCIETLEHTIHPKKVLKELFRVLKSGGLLIITYPLYNQTVIRKIERKLKIRQNKRDSEHLNEWEFNTLINELRQVGFSIKRYEGIAFDFGKIIGGLFKKHSKIAKKGVDIGLYITKYPKNSFWVVICAVKRNKFK